MVVRTVALASLEVLNHHVGEPLDVARRLQNGGGCHGSAGNLKHVVVHDEVLPPCVNEVGFDRAADWTVVVQTSDT